MFYLGTVIVGVKSTSTYTKAVLIIVPDKILSKLKAESCSMNHPFCPGWGWGGVGWDGLGFGQGMVEKGG